MGRLYYQSTFPIKDIGIVFPTFYILLDGFEYIIIFCFAGYSFKIHENSKDSEKSYEAKVL